jgi:hypothetical protein
MSEPPTTTSQPFPIRLRRYLFAGMKCGFLLSLSYASLFALYFNLSLMRTGASLMTVIVGLILTLGTGLLIGVIPSTLLGALTGILIGAIFKQAGTRMTNGLAVTIGLSISLCMVLLLHILLWPPSQTNMLMSNTWQSYFLWLGLPSLIYISIGAWGSQHLHRTLR